MVRSNRWLAAAALATLAISSLATAQQKPLSSQAAAHADASARQAAETAKKVGKGEKNRSEEFLVEQARRAAQIRDANLNSPDKAFYEQATHTKKAQAEHGEWARQQLARAQGIGDATIEEAAKAVNAENSGPKRPRYIVFVSQSMGTNGLKAAFAYGKGREDVFYAFRGFLPNQNPKAFIDAMGKFQGKEPGEMTAISLDPPAFRKYGITKVPAIVRIDDEENMIGKVTGLVNYGWLKEKVEAGNKGDLGERGTTYPIAENDLVEDMKAKAAAFDYKKAAEEAKQRFFQNLPTIELPYATAQRVRKVYPVMTVNEDVIDHEGKVRHRKGDRIDMKAELKRAPVMIIFNSQDKYHVEFAKAMAKKAPPGRHVILMTTRVDREKGIAGYARQEFAIGRPVFLLMPDVQKTFGIERIPTVVTPNDNEFVVVEVPLTQGVSGNARAHTP